MQLITINYKLQMKTVYLSFRLLSRETFRVPNGSKTLGDCRMFQLTTTIEVDPYREQPRTKHVPPSC